MSATYLVDGEAVSLDRARAAFEARRLEELAAAFALVELREKRGGLVATGATPSTESTPVAVPHPTH